MNYRTARFLSSAAALAAVALAFLLYTVELFSTVFIAMCVGIFLLLTASTVISYRFYRCPFCNELLPARSLTIPDCCPKCDKKLEKSSGGKK